MKIIQITDIHLTARGDTRFGVSQYERLAAVIRQVNERHADAAFCVLTGDLTDKGEPTSYDELRAELQHLKVPYRLIPGNHDRRAALTAAFPELGRTPGGFVQYAEDTDAARLLFLDSLDEGRIEGALSGDRLGWLEAQLGEARGKPLLVFIHHPPLKTGIKMLDPLGLTNPGAFLAVLKRHESQVHVFLGHVHRSIHGAVEGVPFTAQRGISIQFALELDEESYAAYVAPPTFGVILVEDNQIVVHEEAFMTGWERYDIRTDQRVG
jgi:3',5'-cyclic AMP phosphodiesterase CpdA